MVLTYIYVSEQYSLKIAGESKIVNLPAEVSSLFFSCFTRLFLKETDTKLSCECNRLQVIAILNFRTKTDSRTIVANPNIAYDTHLY